MDATELKDNWDRTARRQQVKHQMNRILGFLAGQKIRKIAEGNGIWFMDMPYSDNPYTSNATFQIVDNGGEYMVSKVNETDPTKMIAIPIEAHQVKVPDATTALRIYWALIGHPIDWDDTMDDSAFQFPLVPSGVLA